MQRRKPGSWDALVTPEGSASGHVSMKHICIPGEGQPVPLAHITLPSPPTRHGRRHFPTKTLLKGTMFVTVARHTVQMKSAANYVKTKESLHLSSCTECWMSHTVWKERKKGKKVVWCSLHCKSQTICNHSWVCLYVFVWAGLDAEQRYAQREAENYHENTWCQEILLLPVQTSMESWHMKGSQKFTRSIFLSSSQLTWFCYLNS